MNSKIIFLTGCVNPNGMAFTALQNANVRIKQYITAIKWYLENTEIPILFVENTNFDLSPYIDLKTVEGRFEYLTFCGNDYDKSLGKGYGEGVIIKYAVNHSKLMKPDAVLIKITGRLILTNIDKLIQDYDSQHGGGKLIMCDVNRKLTVAFSRVIFMPLGFVKYYLLEKVGSINDFAHYEFECALAEAISNSIVGNEYCFTIFKRPYLLNGMSGTNAVPLKSKSYLTILAKSILFKWHLWAVKRKL